MHTVLLLLARWFGGLRWPRASDVKVTGTRPCGIRGLQRCDACVATDG